MKARSALRVWLVLGVFGCGGSMSADAGGDAARDAGADGGADAGANDLVLSAEPDPTERTDCASTPPAAGEARAKQDRKSVV